MKKPSLKSTSCKCYFVDYNDLEEFVKKCYNIKDYRFAVIEECGNDTDHAFDLDGIIDDIDREDADEIKKGKINTYQNHLLLNCLVEDEFLEPGRYIVNVCW